MESPTGRRRSTSLRTRVRNAIALVTALSLLLFGIPLAIVLGRLIESQALAGLQRDATRAVAAVPDNSLEAGTAVRVPAGTGGTRIGVYDARGVRVTGDGPAVSALAATIGDGREHDGHDGGEVAVVVPVLSDTTVAGSVRAALPLSTLRNRIYEAWSLLAVLALVVVAVAVLLARRAARRISAPFEHLTTAARSLGDGRYDVAIPRWGIPEADAAGDALLDSARQIDALIRHEREFMTDASHQLRTPLAGVLLSLGKAPPDVTTALERTHALETTIVDLLSLRDRSGSGACDPAAIAADAVARWNSADRPVSLRSDDAATVAVAGAALRQGLDVLLDNARRHGRGAITVTVEPYGDAVVIEVADQGVGFADGARFGTGLQMVTRITERAGGSMLIRRRAPRPRIALLLPTAVAERDGPSIPVPAGDPA